MDDSLLLPPITWIDKRDHKQLSSKGLWILLFGGKVNFIKKLFFFESELLEKLLLIQQINSSNIDSNDKDVDDKEKVL